MCYNHNQNVQLQIMNACWTSRICLISMSDVGDRTAKKKFLTFFGQNFNFMPRGHLPVLSYIQHQDVLNIEAKIGNFFFLIFFNAKIKLEIIDFSDFF